MGLKDDTPITRAITSLDRDDLMQAVQAALDAGQDPLEIVDQARLGMEIVGRDFDCGDVFLVELIRAVEIFQRALQLVAPRMKERYGSMDRLGKVVIGTVSGEIHDLGKSIVVGLLRCAGYEVVDLGVDVLPQDYVQAIRREQPQVVGLSAMLTTALEEVRGTVHAIEASGLRPQVKIIAGGVALAKKDPADLGVDCTTNNAIQGLQVIKDWMAQKS